MNYFSKNYLLYCTTLLLLFSACKTSAPSVDQKETSRDSPLAKLFEKSDVFSENFTGFMLYDPQKKQIIYAQNEKKYFTPASNTKLFTFYTGLKLLPDTLPALEYIIRGDSLIFWGTGDPSFLREDLDDGTVYRFLKNSSKNLYYSDSHYRGDGLGPGWAWSDYLSYYSPEKSPFPMYGNMVKFRLKEITITKLQGDSTKWAVSPPYFSKHLKKTSEADNENPILFRGFYQNNFMYHPETDTSTYTDYIPYHYTPELIAEMLSDTLQTTVEYIQMEIPDKTTILYSIPSDTAYKYMLQPSDNFIAEQLLLVTSSVLGKTLNSRKVIRYMKENFLAGMPDEPQWVDGSGMSRYNLFTPRSIIWLLVQIDEEFRSNDKLFELLPAGGQSGTIENWYGARDGGPPYIFAKTGTLRNNHNFSGFLITESGRKLFFSFMNNHYVSSTSKVKEAMEEVFWYIHEHY